jgi:uncharacterized protein
MPLRFNVSDLKVGTPRRVKASLPLDVRLSDSAIGGEVRVAAELESTGGVVEVNLEASAEALLRCVRCASERTALITVGARRLFGSVPDEDGYRLEDGAFVDLEPLIRDELALALPTSPLCRPDCRGLCPTCGADLNTAPCGGHRVETDSPFAALRDLIEPPT